MPAALFNQFDMKIIELPKGTTAGALLTQALWDTARVRKGNREQFAITTNRNGSLTPSREMAMALERENDGLRFALWMSLGIMSRFAEHGMAWNYASHLCIALGHSRLVLKQSAGYDFRYTDRRHFPRDLMPRKRTRVARKPAPAPKALASPGTSAESAGKGKDVHNVHA